MSIDYLTVDELEMLTGYVQAKRMCDYLKDHHIPYLANRVGFPTVSRQLVNHLLYPAGEPIKKASLNKEALLRRMNASTKKK